MPTCTPRDRHGFQVSAVLNELEPSLGTAVSRTSQRSSVGLRIISHTRHGG
ncbi:MAG: hypothetical protein RL695_1018 [Pseudomonadota bacterium]|jgi:hypothetical protein